jgi:hypothetical protein
MPTFEQLLDRYESWHPSIIVDIGCRLHQSRIARPPNYFPGLPALSATLRAR